MPDEPIKDPETDVVDELVRKITARIPSPPPPPTASTALEEPATPPPPPIPTLSPDELEKEFERLINDGKGAEAFRLVRENAFVPQQAAMSSMMRSLADANVRNMRSTYGEKFAKREAAFKRIQKSYNLPDEALADMSVAEKLFKLTLTEDPNYIEEEVKSRLDAASAEAAKAASAIPPGLSPIRESKRIPDSAKEMAEKYLPTDVPLDYIQSQLDVYNIPMDAFLRQAAKADDPESTTGVGAGSLRKTTWTEIGGKSRPPQK